MAPSTGEKPSLVDFSFYNGRRRSTMPDPTSRPRLKSTTADNPGWCSPWLQWRQNRIVPIDTLDCSSGLSLRLVDSSWLVPAHFPGASSLRQPAGSFPTPGGFCGPFWTIRGRATTPSQANQQATRWTWKLSSLRITTPALDHQTCSSCALPLHTPNWPNHLIFPSLVLHPRFKCDTNRFAQPPPASMASINDLATAASALVAPAAAAPHPPLPWAAERGAAYGARVSVQAGRGRSPHHRRELVRQGGG